MGDPSFQPADGDVVGCAKPDVRICNRHLGPLILGAFFCKSYAIMFLGCDGLLSGRLKQLVHFLGGDLSRQHHPSQCANFFYGKFIMKEISTVSVQTMSSREIAEVVGARHDSVKRTIDRLTEKGVIAFTPSVEPTLGGGKLACVCHVNKRDSYVVVAQLSPEFTGKLVDRWQELEATDQDREIEALPANYIQALEALIESEKQKQIAIDTKAEIGTRREATAMNTASTATKRVNKLEVELDQSKMWSTVKRMEIMTGLKFDWRKLKAAESDLGHARKDVYDANYGTVRSYHSEAWKEAYALEINQGQQAI